MGIAREAGPAAIGSFSSIPEAQIASSPARASPELALDERQQVRVELIAMRCHQAVRCARIHLQGRTLEQFGRQPSSVVDRHDLIIVAVEDQHRNVDLLQVLVEVALGELLDAVVSALEASLHALQPELIAEARGDLRLRAIGAVERERQVFVKLPLVLTQAISKRVERRQWQTTRIGCGLDHDRRDCADQRRFFYATSAVPTHVASDFTSTGGVSDEYGIFELQLLEQARKVIGVGIHVIAGPRLPGATVTAAIMGDGAVTVRSEEE